MMALLEKIRADLMTARKARNTVIAKLLGTIVGQCETASKSGKREHALSDDDVMRVVQSIRKGVIETISMIGGQANRADDLEKLEAELICLTGYLPTHMSDTELTDIIVGQHSLGSTMNAVMAYLKQHHNGQYEPKKAISIFREISGG
jgi:uncharacterized protein YqeY